MAGADSDEAAGGDGAGSENADHVSTPPGDRHHRHRDPIGEADRARPFRDDRRGRDAERRGPVARGPLAAAAEHLRAHRGGNRVVHGNPGEVGEVEQRRHDPGAVQPERRARGDHRRHARPGTHGRQQRDEHRAEDGPGDDHEQRIRAAVAAAQHRAGLHRRGHHVGGGEDQEEIEGRLRARGFRNGGEVGCFHGGRGSILRRMRLDSILTIARRSCLAFAASRVSTRRRPQLSLCNRIACSTVQRCIPGGP